ncbi:MAG: MFS transporter [Firmicutes bacterium]|nr:MFS transporter [Bacillota bacterium]
MSDKAAAKSNVFAGRNFRLVFFGALVSDLGAVLYSFAVSFYILEISGNNAFLQGLYLALCGVVLLISTPVGGVLGDRYNKARIMFICDYLKGGLILLATLGILCFPAHGVQLVILFIVGILGNAVSGIFSPSSAALLPHIVPEERLQQANSYFTAKSSLQSILGVVLAGVLYAALPIQILFLFVGICYTLSGVSEMFIRYRHTAPAEKLTVGLVFSDMRDGLRYLKMQKAIIVMLVAILFVNFFISPLTGNFIPYFVKTDIAGASSYLFDKLLTPELWSSVFEMLSGISMLVGSLILSTREQPDKCGHKTALKLCMMAGLMLTITLLYWLLVDRGHSLNLFLILFSLGSLMIGLLIVYINIPISTVIMRIVDKDKLSKVMSIINLFSMGLIPIASVLAGTVLQYAGSTPLLLICSAGFTVTALFMLFNKSTKEI